MKWWQDGRPDMNGKLKPPKKSIKEQQLGQKQPDGTSPTNVKGGDQAETSQENTATIFCPFKLSPSLVVGSKPHPDHFTAGIITHTPKNKQHFWDEKVCCDGSDRSGIVPP